MAVFVHGFAGLAVVVNLAIVTVEFVAQRAFNSAKT